MALSTGAAAAAAQTSASTGGTGAPEAQTVSGLQVQAQELADQIAADGRSLDELASSYQAAQINLAHLSARQATLRQAMAASALAVARARATLKEQALLAYLSGGAPLISYLPDRPGLDPSLTISYAEIIAGGQKDAELAYRATLAAQVREKKSLDATTQEAQVTLAAIRSDAAQANATLADRRQALARVTGQLAAAVAQVQAQQAAAEQAQVEATLAAQGALPPSGGASGGPAVAAGPADTSTRATAPTPTATAPTVPPPTVRAPTTVRSPATTATRPTVAPTTAPAPPTTAAPTPPPPPPTGSSDTAQAPGVSSVLDYARAQLGKPYQWAGAGPDSFDCSGLVMMAWSQAGIYFPHLAQDQYDLTTRIPLSAMIPGDLVFFGTPDNVYHVGIYIGNGNMIDAPETGQDVSVQSIYWDSLLGAGRVTVNS
jgi:cell wall-associated NlpC family hydrolase